MERHRDEEAWEKSSNLIPGKPDLGPTHVTMCHTTRSRMDKLGLTLWICCLLTAWPWASYFASQVLRVSVCTLGLSHILEWVVMESSEITTWDSSLSAGSCQKSDWLWFLQWHWDSEFQQESRQRSWDYLTVNFQMRWGGKTEMLFLGWSLGLSQHCPLSQPPVPVGMSCAGWDSLLFCSTQRE